MPPLLTMRTNQVCVVSNCSTVSGCVAMACCNVICYVCVCVCVCHLYGPLYDENNFKNNMSVAKMRGLLFGIPNVKNGARE